jgi:hypothetical protein
MTRTPDDERLRFRVVGDDDDDEVRFNLDRVPLTVDQWLTRDLPAPDYLIGRWLTTTTRAIMNAATGIGKTNFALALCAHAAAGTSFLHWRAPHRARRVLFIDGEMSRRLLQTRVQDAARRLGANPRGLCVLSHEDVENFPALNSDNGFSFAGQLLEELKRRTGGAPELICFDNVMSLVAGTMKDEEAWQMVLPLITSFTRLQIGQLWVHHTGHDTTKGYGTKTREWELDTVLHLTEIKRPDTDVSFSLEFTKARERTPDTRCDFDEVSIALLNDEWTCSAAVERCKPPSPAGMKYLQALQNVFASGMTAPFESWKAARIEHWRAECVSMGLIESANDRADKNRFSKYKSELIERNQIACHNDLVWLR